MEAGKPAVPPTSNLPERVATVIRAASPLPLCPDCIASRLNAGKPAVDVSAGDVRRAMTVLVSAEQPEFVVVNRVCRGCRTTTKLLALRGNE